MNIILTLAAFLIAMLIVLLLFTFVSAIFEYYFLKFEIEGLDDKWLQVNLTYYLRGFLEVWINKPIHWHEEDFFADSTEYKKLLDYRDDHSNYNLKEGRTISIEED